MQLIGTGLSKDIAYTVMIAMAEKSSPSTNFASTDWHHQSKVPGDTLPTEVFSISAECLQLQCQVPREN